MPNHGGDEPSVMCTFALDAILNDKAFPFTDNYPLVAQECNKSLNQRYFVARLFNAEPEPVLVARARGDNPELVEVLRNQTGNIAFQDDSIDGLQRGGAVWMVRLC